MKRSNLPKLTFTLALAAVCAFGLSLVTSQPANAAPPCPTLACSSSATIGTEPCDYAAGHGSVYRCYKGTDLVGPFWVDCYGNCCSFSV